MAPQDPARAQPRLGRPRRRLRRQRIEFADGSLARNGAPLRSLGAPEVFLRAPATEQSGDPG